MVIYDFYLLQEIKDGSPDTVALKEGNNSEALAQALQEKVPCINSCPTILLCILMCATN